MPPALGNPLSLLLLLAGSAVLAAEPDPAAPRATTAGSTEVTIRPWTARQSPSSDFRPFDPPQGEVRQQPLQGGGDAGSGATGSALREGASLPRASNTDQVVPAAFHAPVPVNAPSPETAPRTAPEAISPPPVLEPVTKEPAAGASPAAAGQDAPLPLAPRRGARGDANAVPRPMGTLSSLLTVGSSLAVVLGLFFIMAWLMRRSGPRGAALLPSEVLEVLGRAPLAARQQVHLIRCGNKLLLVCLGPDGAHTLTEITEPDEVTRLAGLCQQSRSNSTTTAFRQIFQQFHMEAGRAKYVGPSGLEDIQLANGVFNPIQGSRLEDRDV